MADQDEDMGDKQLAKMAELGDLAAVNAAISGGADVNEKNKMGQTALHKAAPGSPAEVNSARPHTLPCAKRSR